MEKDQLKTNFVFVEKKLKILSQKAGFKVCDCGKGVYDIAQQFYFCFITNFKNLKLCLQETKEQ